MSRWVYRVILIAIFLAANFFIVRGIGSVLAFVKSGADREQMMAKVLKVNDYYKPLFSYSNVENPGREFLEKNMGELQRDYTDSWYVKNISFSVNTTKGIADFYTDSSRVNLYDYIDLNKKNKVTVHGTTLSHNIDINFFSADGKLVAFDDNGVREVQRIFKGDSLVGQHKSISNYKIVMLLEDGFWRIRHMVRSNAEDTIKIKPDSIVADLVQRKEKNLVYNGVPFYIRGINYYPKDSPWEMFGSKFNDSIISQDFKLIRELGFNTARIFVNFNDFGRENVNPVLLAQLKRTLDIAEEEEVKVIVTLFDFFGNYNIINWSLTEQHIKQIVTPLKKHKAILAWDVKNEADLDMQVHSEAEVKSWLEFAMERIKYYDPNHLLTIGWLHPHPFLAKDSPTDFLTFHFYQDLDRFAGEYNKWQSHTDKPVVVGEFGLHTWKKAFFGNSENKQKAHYKHILDKVREQEQHFIAWTLYDFKELPPAIFGKKPWVTIPQKHMGVLNYEGEPKKVMQVISSN